MKNFKILVLGPAGSGKSSFISAISKLDIFNYISAKKLGGANTTKVSTTYEFTRKTEVLEIVDCTTKKLDEHEAILNGLRELSKEEDGIEKVFGKINNESFSQKCKHITISLPCKEEILKNNKFEKLIIHDSRGFGDLSSENLSSIDYFNMTEDINAIYFFSISSIQQPAIFNNIIDLIMSRNLKTPMFLLRREEFFTINDDEFNGRILLNLKNNDEVLYNCILEVSNKEINNKLSNFIFNLPNVNKWKGAIGISEESHLLEKQKYSDAAFNVINYSIEIYENLYNIIVSKMKGKYESLFINEVLNNLLSDKAFDAIKIITKNPSVNPYGDAIDRDTRGLRYPVKLINSNINEDEPFKNELMKKGNRYKYGEIPYYSYSCVNFRQGINYVSWVLCSDIKNKKLSALFQTFMSILIEDYTVNTYTGYSIPTCQKLAFKFSKFIEAREMANEFLKNYDLVSNRSVWKEFKYTIKGKEYIGSESIVVLIYKNLIQLLNLEEKFNEYRNIINEHVIEYTEINNEKEIEAKLLRK